MRGRPEAKRRRQVALGRGRAAVSALDGAVFLASLTPFGPDETLFWLEDSAL
jgi:hypothetical protein